MNKLIILAVSVLVALSFSACGSSSSGSDTSTPDLLVASDRNISMPENESLSFDVSQFIQNADSYCFIDTDNNLDTVVSSDCKSFTSSDVNITLVDSNLTVVSSNIDTTVTHSFVVRGSDDNNDSVDSSIILEIVDNVDDQAIVVSDIDVVDSITFGKTFSLEFEASDSDGMESVTIELIQSASVLDTRYVYVDINLSKIDVNEDFTNLSVGSYSLSISANGVIGGEGDRSSYEESFTFIVDSVVVTPPTTPSCPNGQIYNDDVGGCI